MTLSLYFHPLSSFSWKALIPLYDAGIAFEPKVVNPGDPASLAAFHAVWPLGKFPVLRDDERGLTIPESTIIIEYLAQHHPAARGLIPTDPDQAQLVRLKDRLIDSYIHLRMQQIVGDRLRPEDKRDPFGVDQARDGIRKAYDLIEPMIEGPLAMGETFTLVDCAALPALFYADYCVPLSGWPALADYLEELKARPSVARVLQEAQPYFQYFPLAGEKA